jgi:hypothetical protein
MLYGMRGKNEKLFEMKKRGNMDLDASMYR